MGGRLRIVAGVTGLLVLGLYPAQARQAAPAIDKTDNVKHVKQFAYEGAEVGPLPLVAHQQIMRQSQGLESRFERFKSLGARTAATQALTSDGLND